MNDFTEANKDKDKKSEETLSVLTPLQSSVMQLADGFHSILSEETYMRTRERVHRDSKISINSFIYVESHFKVQF